MFVQPGEAFAGSVKEAIPTPDMVARVEGLTKEWWDKPMEEIHRVCPFWYSWNWIRRRAPWFYSFGHLGMAWEDLLSSGLGGLRRKAADRLAADNLKPEQTDFLTGALECYDAIIAFVRRYADAASGDMAADLRHIAENPPATLRQALQLIWLVTLVMQKVCGCGVLNFSRMDQYLMPYYRADSAAGLLDRAEAVRLFKEFFFKNNEIMAPADHMSLETEATDFTLEVTFDDPNYITVGGLLPDGASGVNELSFILVEAAHALRLRNPFMVARHHRGIDQKFLLAVADAIRDNTTIVLYSDEAMLPALREFGVTDPTDLYNYGFFGCNDPDFPGVAGGLRQMWFNLAKPLELALNRGDYPLQPRAGQPEKDCQWSLHDRMVGLMEGAYYGVDTGDLDAVRSMDDFVEMYRKQSLYLLREYRRGFERDFAVEQECTKGHLRIEDCFLRGTIEDAVSWTLGGTKYHKITAQGSGMATVVDSLYASEEVVFNRKEMSLKEFATVLANNFAGHEALQQRLRRRLAKFGNDEDQVDKYAKTVVDIFCDCIREVNGQEYLYHLIPTLSSDRDFTTMGGWVGATPDGRSHGERLSENQSPSEGKDTGGLTAMLNSLSKVPFHRVAGGPLNVKVFPGSISGDAGLRNFAALITTYFENGGLQMQFNIVDRDQLVEAQNNPDKHRNLCIRVTGYSAFFVQMGAKAQAELIARTEQNA